MTGNNVVVIGGGFAGVMAANRLTKRDDVIVTLINPRPRFVARLRLHQLVAGTHDAVTDYEEVLSKRVQQVIGTAAQIDAGKSSVELVSGETVAYDYLIYAVGSGSAVPSVPGGPEFAYPIDTLEGAQRLRPVVDATPATATITVVGAGPTGIETAAELAEQGRRVTLLCGGVLGPYLHVNSRRSVAKRLTELGVTVLEGGESRVTAVTRDTVQLSGGHTLSSAVTIWTAGFGIPDLAARSGLSTDSAGRLLTDETLTSVDDSRIIAAGDSAAPSAQPFRMSAYAAGCLGAHAADTVLNRMAGVQPDSLHLRFNGMCISLGRGAGIFQFAAKDDTANKFSLRGRPGATIKELACNAAVKHLTKEARKPGSNTWRTDDKHRQRLLEYGEASASR
ncbi:NAD(P)/FAD-dependent oxidoreductase [Nocardia mexicana]|uniref:NADH dehydrogenase FAD-containing subunit n=1 Tax=Nocardia mexicana TaxID=279262 RepID=A0A370GNL5_9NOCA|nr:FAD-dependent oxidoreductase [Nocardia mexicana]RDI45332.1 NADH dehydrogenase FAD-containing subunit [Nocardia mexicana]